MASAFWPRTHLVFAGFPIAMLGGWVFFEKPLRSVKYTVAIWAVFISIISGYTFVDPSLTARAISTAVVLSLISIILGVVLIVDSTGKNNSGVGLGWFYILHSVGNIVRIPGMAGAEVSDLFNVLVIDQIFYSEAIIAGVLAPLGYILMTNERLLNELKAQADSDPLTRLLNRGAFYAAVKLVFACNKGRQSPSALLAIDIDHFKSINENFGHQVGDENLVLLIDNLRSELRESDVPARFGGEEFIVALYQTRHLIKPSKLRSGCEIPTSSLSKSVQKCGKTRASALEFPRVWSKTWTSKPRLRTRMIVCTKPKNRTR